MLTAGQVIDRYEVDAPVAGTTCRVDLEVGDPVSKGQVLTTLKPLESQALDPRSRAVYVDGRFVELTAKEFDLLWFLARHPRQVFNREQLLDQVWGYDFYGDDSTVTVHIRRLREKIEHDPGQPAIILTVWGVGYKLQPGQRQLSA